jgi:DNA polymerase alpha subunit A
MRRLDKMPYPGNLDLAIRQKRDSNIQKFDNEKQMLEQFINRLVMIDPDLLIAHNLCGGIFEVLLARIQFNKIMHWSRIGRFRRSNIPNKKFD